MSLLEDIRQQQAERSQALSMQADALLVRMDDLAFHALRLELARLGWTSTLEVTSSGWGSAGFGLTVRLRRWSWHGRRSLSVFDQGVGGNRKRMQGCCDARTRQRPPPLSCTVF